MKRLHIIGCPRSGTTLLMELISTCFRSDGHCQHERSVLQNPGHDYPVYFSKCPWITDAKYIQRVFATDPDLFLIYIMRDPRDVISSMHSTLNPDGYLSSFAYWKVWDIQTRPLTADSRYLSLRYEDLVTDPDAVQKQLTQAFPFLEKLHDFSEYALFSKASRKALAAMNGLRPVSTDSIGNWKNHLPRVKAQLIKYPDLAALLIEHGYEKDMAWTSLLDPVTPEPVSDPVWIPWKVKWKKKVRTWLRFRRKMLQLSASRCVHLCRRLSA